jgi:hypothetical protein
MASTATVSMPSLDDGLTYCLMEIRNFRCPDQGAAHETGYSAAIGHLRKPSDPDRAISSK